MFFDEDGICHVTNKIPYIIIFFLSLIAPEGYKIMISYSEDYIHEVEYKLWDNGVMKERIDNLTNVFRKKHVLKVPDKPDRYITTSMTNYRFENGTYSHFLINLCLDLYSIEHIIL